MSKITNRCCCEAPSHEREQRGCYSLFYFFACFSLEVWFFSFTFACKSRFLMVNLEKFRENARKEGMCDRYAVLWDGCGSKKGLMDLALSAQGADFLCDGIAKGWGISADEIVKRFGRYINGVYTYEDASGYTSVMYCKYYGEIVVDDTLLVLIDCDATVVVPDWGVVDIYATGLTNLSIVGGGRVRLIAYGDKANVTVESVDAACRFKRIQKLCWSRGE